MKFFENSLLGWHKKVPHLSQNKRDWLADNTWRIDIIGMILTVLSIFVLIPLLFTVIALTPVVNGLIAPYVPYYQESLGYAWIALLLVAVVFFVTAVMLSVAVNPLREKKRRGWYLIFQAYILNVLSGIVTTILVPSVVEMFVVVIVTFFIGYYLFEIRGEFGHTVHRSAK